MENFSKRLDEWSIFEEGFDKDKQLISESIFSLGNAAMGQRANFEETYTGKTFRGSYIAGVYYPDRTKVGWWKNGYPEYFAKVLNAPNWIGIDIEINGENLDLNNAKEISNFSRELNMKEGFLRRSFEAELQNGSRIKVNVIRFLSMKRDELGAIRYEITPIENSAKIVFKSYVDANIKNRDSNWDEIFWEVPDSGSKDDFGFVRTRTYKTNFEVMTYMQSSIFQNGKKLNLTAEKKISEKKVSHYYTVETEAGNSCSIVKFGGYLVSTRQETAKFYDIAKSLTENAEEIGFDALLEEQKQSWAEIWKQSDVEINGDLKAQQSVRYCIFQLNQTYNGKYPDLNIGPKGFTGEKYGGSTYWDTEAFCLPFYLSTKASEVAKNLLLYRYNHLEKAIENAQKLGFTDGAALYPMVTMNGEECHNEWEITFEEIHRNGAIAYAIYNYVNYTGDQKYIAENGLEVLIGICRFWAQRMNFSKPKNSFVILGVTGPNEYENNVSNNFYTNYIAKWCLEYTLEQIQKLKTESKNDFDRIQQKTKLMEMETADWKKKSENLYLPYSEELGIYLQQDGFLDKEIRPVSELKTADRPLNQKWSWDRILRSPFIKQADVLQGIYFFEENFSPEEIKKHFEFYEPLTVHESSLSPAVHSILAAKIGKTEKAYELLMRTARLDLDDYNKEAEEGLHITSMSGARLAVVQGFAGMQVKEGKLYFEPKIPDEWESYKFSIVFRERILTVTISKNKTDFDLEGEDLEVFLNGEKLLIKQNQI